ncbi:MAG TPA: DUF1667 domain-containing protein [Rectinemataceae bacterium]|nr:DUF1667 domain-containing protein [Rectinemataceae bacterium]
MSQELVCITCPMGCHLVVERAGDGDLSVSGNRCPRGAAYAREELLAPKRTVTATCRIVGQRPGAVLPPGLPRRLPCRSSAPFPREDVPRLLDTIYGLEVPLPVASGQVLLADALGSGIDIVATRSIKEQPR